jgi:hypothetical protein
MAKPVCRDQQGAAVAGKFAPETAWTRAVRGNVQAQKRTHSDNGKTLLTLLSPLWQRRTEFASQKHLMRRKTFTHEQFAGNELHGLIK